MFSLKRPVEVKMKKSDTFACQGKGIISALIRFCFLRASFLEMNNHFQKIRSMHWKRLVWSTRCDCQLSRTSRGVTRFQAKTE